MKRHVLILGILLVLFAAVGAGQQSTELRLDVIKTEPVPLAAGEYATVWVEVRNNGSITANDVTVQFEPTYPFSVDPGERTEWNLGDVVPGQEYQLRLRVLVDGNAVHGEHNLRFTTSTGQGNVQFTRDLPVDVRDDDTALIIDGVDLPERVAPGSTNDVTVTLRNLANTQFKNIDVELDLDDLPIAVGDTSRKRVPRLGGGETVNVTYRMFVDEAADRGIQRIPVSLEYQNVAGNSFTQEQTTGVVVGGYSDIAVGVERTDIYSAGTRGELTLRVVNRGAGEASFVNVAIPDAEEYEVLSSPDIYIGNMIPDDYQTAEFDIYVENAVDSLQVPVKVSYVNAEGRSVEETQEIHVQLYEDALLARYGLANGTDPFLYLALVAVVAIVLGAVYWRRRSG